MTDFKLDPEVKRKWISDLRSGQFKQGKGMLCRVTYGQPNEYCCLGVLVHDKINEGGQFQFKKNLFCEELPEAIIPEKIQDKLITLNDVLGWNFNQIADWIEKNL